MKTFFAFWRDFIDGYREAQYMARMQGGNPQFDGAGNYLGEAEIHPVSMFF